MAAWRSSWTLEDAVAFIRDLHVVLKPVGVEVGLTGGVLLKGDSKKDLDVILYPRTRGVGVRSDVDYPRLAGALKAFGMRLMYDREFVTKMWRRKGSYDSKWVEVWSDRLGRRVDFFILDSGD